MLAPWKESYDQPRQHTKKQRDYFADKGPSSQSYGFSSSQVWMWKLDYKESWAPKKWYFLTVVLEKTLESPLDCKEIQPVHSEGDQPWIFIGRTDAEVETPILWPPDVKSWLIGKRPWCWERVKEGGEGDDRGWDGWMASPTQWTWVWANSGSWCWTGKPVMLQSMELQRVLDTTEGLDWTELSQIMRGSFYYKDASSFRIWIWDEKNIWLRLSFDDEFLKNYFLKFMSWILWVFNS